MIPNHAAVSSIVVLFRGGRLPAWHRLAPSQRREYEQEHVDLMLSVARQHRMKSMEGFRLIAPQERWERFWIIEFPSLEGAEAWIEAEMAPPYGLYGFYEYYLSRPFRPDEFSTWVTHPRLTSSSKTLADPHQIPSLEVDLSGIVVLLFGRSLPGSDAVDPSVRGDQEHIDLMKGIAREHRMMRLEAFQLIDPQPDWHRAWVMEFPDLAGAEAWIDGEILPPHGAYSNKIMYLARRWAPEYFSSWVPR